MISRSLLSSLACLSLLACSVEDAAESQDVKEIAKATIVFDAAFEEKVDGQLVEGGKVVLDYDDVRVEECQSVQGGIPQYAVTAYWQIDDGEVGQLVVAGLQAPDSPTIKLDAPGTLTVWFEATSSHGCHVWDSDFGNNYKFEVAERP